MSSTACASFSAVIPTERRLGSREKARAVRGSRRSSTRRQSCTAPPLNIVPSDDDLLTVDIEALAVRGQVVSIIGKLGESLGIIVFRSRSDFEQYLAEAEHYQRTRGIAECPIISR